MHFLPFLLTLRIDGKRKGQENARNALAGADECQYQLTNDLRCAKKDFFVARFWFVFGIRIIRKISLAQWGGSKSFQERKVASEKENENSRATAKENYEKLSKLSLIFPKFSHFSHVFFPRSLLSTFSPFSKQLREILSFAHRKTRILRLFLFSFLPISVARSSRFPRRDN